MGRRLCLVCWLPMWVWLGAACERAPTDVEGPPSTPAPELRPQIPGDDELEHLLSETGLFGEGAAPVAALELVEIEPRFPLWSDGASKRRWLYLPPGASLDTSDPDHWQLPVGGVVIKEFSAGSRRLETRLIARVGPGADDYWMGAYVWDDAGADARLARDGATDVGGSQHDVPSQQACRTCHNGEPGRVLGLSAVQLGQSPVLAQLAGAGRLSHPVPTPHLPGDPATVEALGYLHANCGSCHNPRGTAWPDTDLALSLPVGLTTPDTAPAWASTLGQRTSRRLAGFPAQRVVAGAPAESALVARMATREPGHAMPPIASERVDDVGVATVSAWISALPTSSDSTERREEP